MYADANGNAKRIRMAFSPAYVYGLPACLCVFFPFKWW